MPQLNCEDRQIVRHPNLKYTSIEIRMNDLKDPEKFVITANTALNLQELQDFSELVSGVLMMEINRLSQLDENNEPGMAAKANESGVTT